MRCLMFCAAAFIAAAGSANSAELVAQKSDTFIFEGIPDGEFSKSDFIAVSYIDGEKAIAYLPFAFRATDAGIVPGLNRLTLGKLSLYIKALPILPDTNANASKKPSDKEDDDEKNPPDVEDLEKAATDAAAYSAEKAEAAAENVLRFEFFGVCDTESFVPNSKNFRVSWDGKNDSPPPKLIDGKLDLNGMMKLGELEINLDETEIDDGYKVEFATIELENFLNFAYGLEPAKGVETPFASLEHASIIVRQTAGPSGVIFYSADSIGQKTDKEQSGDEGEKDSESENLSPDLLRDAANSADASGELMDFRPKITFEIVNFNIKRSEQ